MKRVEFCQGCNTKFEVDLHDLVCPVCEQALAPLPTGTTRDVFEIDSRESTVLTGLLTDVDQLGLIGTELDSYAVESFLGKGGMARVYKARHTTLLRPCALKVLSPRMVARDPRCVELFFSEARSAAALVHPNVVTIHNIGHADEHHYIEMEFVNGRSLRRMIMDEGPADVARMTDFLSQTCAALAAAHRLGIVHRDLKPANILLTTKGTAKLADFGLAKRVIAAGEASLSEKGLAGTPHFMAPELFRGESATRRSDVYAVGVTYYNALAGRLPFVASTVGELSRLHTSAPVPELESLGIHLPKDVLSILETSLAKDPSARYPDAEAMCEELLAVLAHLRDMDSLVEEALSGLDLQWAGGEGRYRVRVDLPEGRSQQVFIETASGSPLAERLVRIYSVCAPLREDYYRRALELNSEMPHGSIAIQNVSGQPHFVMVDTYPRATCDAEEVRRSVMTIARWSDDVERALTRRDHH